MNQPLYKYNAASISCAVWANQINVNGKTVQAPKATVERRYRDKDGNWRSTGSFSRNEIPMAIVALQKAYEAILRGDAKQQADGGPEGAPPSD